jgi:uncharacterized membrane protein YphA (DoxX/SURF4 family)
MWLDKITQIGRFFFAIPMIVFGIQHFMYAQFVAELVPSWIPGALFWTYFSGVALFCSGLGIFLNLMTRLAAGLLGSMIFIWIIVLHIPRVFLYPENHNEFINVFDACLICGGALTLSGSSEGKFSIKKIEIAGCRIGPYLMAIALLVFGVEHLIQQKLVFIVGAEYFSVPGSAFWIIVSGIVFILAAIGIFTKRSQEVAAYLGVFIFFMVSIFYIPQLFNTIYVGHALATFLKGMAMSGSAFILSKSIAKNVVRQVALPA